MCSHVARAVAAADVSILVVCFLGRLLGQSVVDVAAGVTPFLHHYTMGRSRVSVAITFESIHPCALAAATYIHPMLHLILLLPLLSPVACCCRPPHRRHHSSLWGPAALT